eukprot:3763137-Pyramimonas_sp.AAC.2
MEPRKSPCAAWCEARLSCVGASTIVRTSVAILTSEVLPSCCTGGSCSGCGKVRTAGQPEVA